MKLIRPFKVTALLCIVLTASVYAVAHGRPSPKKVLANKNVQTGFVLVIVNGRTLTGPNSTAQSRGGRILIPVASVARALGDTLNINAAKRTVAINRQTGAVAVFDASLGQIRENGSVVLSISNSGEIAFPVNADELLLAVEIASLLFDASIRFDTPRNRVLVSRGQGVAGVVVKGGGRRLAELYQADYEYNVSRYSSSLARNLIVAATGRLADGRFFLTSNSSGSSLRQFSPRNYSFNIERPNGQRLIAGDFGSGAALPLLTANVRGGLASIPLGSFNIAAFGGRASSGTVLPVLQDEEAQTSSVRNWSRFDTNVLGFYLSSASGDRTKPLTISAGAMRFSGATRSGTLTSASLNYADTRLRLQADVGLGNFEGRARESRRVDGSAAAVDLAATYQLSGNLSIQARYAHIGANFLSPQSGAREPIDLGAAGVTWSPVKWLSASVNASTAKRPNETGRADSLLTAAFGVTPGGGKPRFYFSHTQTSTKLIRSGAFTLFNASKDFARWHVFVNAIRAKIAGPATTNAQFGASVSINDTNSVELSQGVGSKRNLNGLIDWRTSGLLGKRISLTVGAGYSYSHSSKVSAFQRTTASLTLPRQSSLQVSYIHSNAGPTVLVQLRGTLFRKKEAGAYLNALQSEANNFGAVSGRVYQDVDDNGQFDIGTDKPQSQVKVRVDGNRYVETNADGIFRFEAIVAGDHRVYLDLLSVRADLTLPDGSSRNLTIGGGRSSTFDFRLVRTGRIAGRVFLDKNANGKLDDGESPLADVRVVTASGRDTLTDADGYFTIADLAPGEHVVFIDEKTLPEKTISAARPLTARVFAGRETNEIFLTVIETPAEIKHFGKANQER